jgi:uncharacterized YccA/Bax inhibitor family protein
MVLDFLARCLVLDFSGWVVLIGFTVAGYVLISQMIGDHGSALFGAPFLAMGAAIGNGLMHEAGLVSASDKVMNMVVGMTGGMLVGAIIAVALLWGWNSLMAR